MSINTTDFAALAVTVVLFAVIYYLDYKKGVDFGLLTLLATVFGIAVGLGFGNHFTYVEIFGRIYTNVLTALVVPMLLFSIIASITNLSESIHLKKIGGKSIFFLILNTAIASTITVIVAVILNVGDGFAYKVADGYQKVEVPSVVDTIVNLFPSNLQQTGVKDRSFQSLYLRSSLHYLTMQFQKIMNQSNHLKHLLMQEIRSLDRRLTGSLDLHHMPYYLS